MQCAERGQATSAAGKYKPFPPSQRGERRSLKRVGQYTEEKNSHGGESDMISGPALLERIRQPRLLEEDQIDQFDRELRDKLADARLLVDELVRRELLTSFQAGRLLSGDGAELSIGQHVILDRLGEGGMGQVLKARHRLLRRIDAIKIIRPDCLTTRQAVDRFYREAQAVA